VVGEAFCKWDFSNMGRVDVEVRKGSIRCDVWVVGVLGSPREDDVSRKFPKFVWGHSSSH
jgi:hypothetical protein